MKFKKIIKAQSGIGLVEIVLSLGVAIIVVTAMVSLSIFTLRSSLQGELLFEGSKYANEYLERVRALRDSSVTWSSFMTTLLPCDTANCTISQALAVASSTETLAGNPTVSRSFRATTPAGGTISTTDTTVRISVTVTWNIGGQNKSTYVYTDLTNWRNR